MLSIHLQILKLTARASKVLAWTRSVINIHGNKSVVCWARKEVIYIENEWKWAQLALWYTKFCISQIWSKFVFRIIYWIQCIIAYYDLIKVSISLQRPPKFIYKNTIMRSNKIPLLKLRTLQLPFLHQLLYCKQHAEILLRQILYFYHFLCFAGNLPRYFYLYNAHWYKSIFFSVSLVRVEVKETGLYSFELYFSLLFCEVFTIASFNFNSFLHFF